VIHVRGGHLQDPPASAAHPQAEVDILRAVEIGLIHAADTLIGDAAEELARADAEVDVPRD
jgi:hypothetical protein